MPFCWRLRSISNLQSQISNRKRGIALLEALVGLTLVATATMLMMQSVAASTKAERVARERLIATQWLAGDLEELRATGHATSPVPQSLRQARIQTALAPLPVGRLQRATLRAVWRDATGAERVATLEGVVQR